MNSCRGVRKEDAVIQACQSTPRKAASLVEVLIVIAIITLLLQLALPAVEMSREAARRTQCINNIRQYGVAFQQFDAHNGAFPSGLMLQVTGPLAGESDWRVHNYMADLLPMLDPSIASQYHRDQMFCSPENQPAIAASLSVAICPSGPGRDRSPKNYFLPSVALFTQSARESAILGGVIGKLDKKYATEYLGGITDYVIPTNAEDGVARDFGYQVAVNDPVGLGSVFPQPFEKSEDIVLKLTSIIASNNTVMFDRRIKTAEITDGLSYTFIMTEDVGRPQRWQRGKRTKKDEPLRSAWADPGTILRINGYGTSEGRCLLNCENEDEIYSFHPGIVNFLFADGHVESVQDDTDPRVVLEWLTRAGGDGGGP